MALTATTDDVARQIAALLRVPADRVRPDTLLADLITESFLLVELVIDLQEEFGVRFLQDDVAKVRTVEDVANLVALRSGAGISGTG
jgi:acyl carrier protein